VTIKSDRWIRRMALEKKMIEPFEEKQVRQGVVSYGLSSYGYDLRVADEFKIFTNVNSTIIDPKTFDDRSFVDVKGNCIVPPNSFALARTVEYLRIPRNVLTICLGKCVTGDTRVVDADTGAYLPISEFRGARRTIGLDGWRPRAMQVTDFIPQGRKPVFELTTRTGLRIKATANHPFRQLDGWTELSELRPGDRIAVARQVSVFGKTPLGPSAAEELARDMDRREGVPAAVFLAPADDVATFLRALFSRHGTIGDTDVALDLTSRRTLDDVRHLLLRFGIVSTTTERLELTSADMIVRFAERIGVHLSRSRTATRRLSASGAEPSSAAMTVATLDDEALGSEDAPLWDAVESITPAGIEEVFDLTVPQGENFLANGIYCHNSTYARCGIIVNVTPFEPEWEGHATLEISNTTPLPARIYANEGLCQVLFFESDEPCQVSYADKKGKYQAQGPEIVLPRM
jgi:deoxycytidine triphosphate deaminase